jgi:UDP-N-acetylmuramyl pentapeptide phosphotransferase/UDP-N-acetylglucosamine-1-phosphate transferase
LLAVMLLSWYVAPYSVKLCRRLGMMAAVVERSSHSVPTPHGGGFVMPLLFIPVGLALTWLWPLPFKGFLTMLMLAGALVAYVGWLDDRHELSPRFRLIIHLLAVAITLALLPRLFDFMPLWLEKTILMFGWAWFVNLYNFMDGADGLASSEAVALGLGVSLMVPAFAPLGLLLAAVALGFLRVNAPKAKVFMGDVGATWLGYTIAGLFLLAAVDDTVNIIWPLATLPLVFAADATFTLFRRIITGHKPWEPHKTFWFHRYMALGHSHKQLVRAVALVNLSLVGLGLACHAIGYSQWAFIVGVLEICAIACYIRHRERTRTPAGSTPK